MTDVNDPNDVRATPISHSRHQRYRQDARKRHSKQFEAFLTAQAARLSTTTDAIFAYLETNTADQIAAAANTGVLAAGEPAGH